jgi:hypothetical protein
MKTHLIPAIALLLAGSAARAAQMPPTASTPAAPTAAELLDRYAQSLAPLTSFIAQWEAVDDHDDREGSRTRQGRQTTLGEMRADASRITRRERYWGDHGGTQEKPNYFSQSFVPPWTINYTRHQDLSWIVIGPPAPQRGADINGFCRVLSEFVPDALAPRLRDSNSLRLRPKLEPAGWDPTPCYVLEAKTRYGAYTLWLDPTRSYNLARAQVLCGPSDLMDNGKPISALGHIATANYLDKVRYEQRDGIWIPFESAGHGEDRQSNYVGKSNAHVRITRIDLKPDHAALGSFLIDDIPDDNDVSVTGQDGKAQGMGKWHAGRVLDPNGKVLFDGTSVFE